jgi:predicted Zn-ribbon and HTH transcriptional regulator
MRPMSEYAKTPETCSPLHEMIGKSEYQTCLICSYKAKRAAFENGICPECKGTEIEDYPNFYLGAQRGFTRRW